MRLNNHMIRYLYETIPHPVDTLLGERFRRADGSGNNVYIPSIGQAGLPYARTGQGKHHLKNLPEPATVFDELLKAPSKTRDPHPGGNSSLTFAFASLVTHSLFRTDPSDWNKNLTSSYLDLSPLYGSNQEEQDAVRIKNGFGRLHPDTFSEGRIVFLPPAAAALLIVWNRNHNHIVDTLLKNNEQGRWFNPPPDNVSQRMTQDEELFQTARLINCGSFMSVVLNDYVAGFIGNTRTPSKWALAPFDPFRDTNHTPVGRGEGNHVSVEFDILYRWHSVVSHNEEKWTLGLLEKLFPGKNPGELTKIDFFQALGRLRSGPVDESLVVHPDPSKRNFGGIFRGKDGRFKDDDIAKLLQDATEDPACRYGARGTPEALKVIEIVGMEQARRWGVCTMNEFRVRMGLKPFDSFEEWAGATNPDAPDFTRKKEVADAAKKLYSDINNLELYPGLHAEETMAAGPGSGLCAGYTQTRGILSDAIALVRGDRYFTHDFTPANLTSWGIDDVQREENPGFGAYLPKLLQRALSNHYPQKSVFTWFPFFTPTQSRIVLKDRGLEDKYEFDRPPAGGSGQQ
ncbi:heme peroxidase [Rhizoctonia solani]|nr:heme peroxidase [Rhizoctonia solani]